jgi:hypothetical protein
MLDFDDTDYFVNLILTNVDWLSEIEIFEASFESEYFDIYEFFE